MNAGPESASAGTMNGRRLHLIGIGGAGMSGLALAARELGAEVSGSDRELTSYTERLEKAGVAVTIGHDAGNVPPGADVVRSTAIADDNPEWVVAEQRGQRLLHRSQLLAEFAALRPLCITVAGTHGKTTTTAMIAHVLDALGMDPSYFVGGEVTVGQRTTNAHIGDGEIIVIEADESDGSFTRYSPQIAVVTNIEFEHPETWSGIDELLAAFRTHVAPATAVVVPVRQPRIDELDIAGRDVRFGIAPDGGNLIAEDVVTADDPSAGTSFSVGGTRVELGVRGEHNVRNALAALAALACAGVELARAAPALAGFRGVARRFERLGVNSGGAVVYDDYAHHPTEVVAALTTARGAAAGGRVIAVYQPHLFSRAAAYRREFGEALAYADVVVVLDVYAARERAEDHPGVTGWFVATAVADAAPGMPVYYAPGYDDAEQLLARILRPGDLCIAIGAGSITRLAHRVAGA